YTRSATARCISRSTRSSRRGGRRRSCARRSSTSSWFARMIWGASRRTASSPRCSRSTRRAIAISPTATGGPSVSRARTRGGPSSPAARCSHSAPTRRSSRSTRCSASMPRSRAVVRVIATRGRRRRARCARGRTRPRSHPRPGRSVLHADAGGHVAGVVKVGLPGTGDETRTWMPPEIKGVSAYYLAINRNKRSITLDLKHADGKRVLERLIERSDVLVENFSPGTLAHLGFPDDRIRAIEPRVIVCHISGFGQDGPGRAWPAYDLIVQGMGGIMSLTGEPGSDPVMVGVPQADMVAGMFAAFAVAAALYARQASGEGQVIDATMIGGQVALLSRQAARFFADGTVPR